MNVPWEYRHAFYRHRDLEEAAAGARLVRVLRAERRVARGLRRVARAGRRVDRGLLQVDLALRRAEWETRRLSG
jgi:hypothetical protein